MGRVLSIQPYFPANSPDVRGRMLTIRDVAIKDAATGPEAEIFSALVAQFIAVRSAAALRNGVDALPVSSRREGRSRTYANATRSYKAAAELVPVFDDWEIMAS